MTTTIIDMYRIAMTLGDARIVLHHYAITEGYGDQRYAEYDLTMAELQYETHELLEFAELDIERLSKLPSHVYTDHDRFLDQKAIAELAMIASALHVLNRHMPVTQRHAHLCRDLDAALMVCDMGPECTVIIVTPEGDVL